MCVLRLHYPQARAKLRGDRFGFLNGSLHQQLKILVWPLHGPHWVYARLLDRFMTWVSSLALF